MFKTFEVANVIGDPFFFQIGRLESHIHV